MWLKKFRPWKGTLGIRNGFLVGIAGIATAVMATVLPKEAIPPPVESSDSTAAFAFRDTLSWAEVRARIRARNPDLRALAWEYRALDSRRRQEARMPNPEAEAEFENFGGNGEFQGAEGLESTIGLSQTLELAGKRKKRSLLAAKVRDLAGWDYAEVRMEILSEAARSFTELLAAQERLAVLAEDTALAAEVLRNALRRHQSGKAPLSEEMKARIALSRSRSALYRAEQERWSAQVRLASLWGGEGAYFNGISGPFKVLPDLPDWDTLVLKLDQVPALARWETEMEQRRAAVAMEEALRVPNLALGGGVKHSAASGDVGLVAGVSIPVPVFNRNRDGIREARDRLARAEYEYRGAKVRWKTRLRTLHRSLVTRAGEARRLREEILPQAEEVLHFTQEAYRIGRLGYLEVLDSQRTRLEARLHYIEVLANYRSDWAELENALGYAAMPADTSKGTEP